MTTPLTTAEGYAEHLRTPLPVAVYGTLRPGWGNSRLWRGKGTELAVGHVNGYKLVGRGFPYAVPTKGATSVVSIIRPEPEHYYEVLADMDALEGVDFGHYKRVDVEVQVRTGHVICWMYVPVTIDGYVSRSAVVPTDAWGRHDWNLVNR